MRFTVVESEREGGRRCSAGARPRHAPGRSKWEAFAEDPLTPRIHLCPRCREASGDVGSTGMSAVRSFSHSCPPIHTRGRTLRLSTDAEDRAMPSKSAIQRARKDKREGKSPSTQAGEFVREEIEHVREGKHGARSTKQAIAIGLSEARSAGVDVPAKGKAAKKSSAKKSAAKKSSTKKSSTKKAASKKTASKKAATKKTASKKTARKSSETKATRSRAATKALKKEGSAAASKRALSRQGHQAAAKRSAADRSAAAKKAARTKGAKGRSAAAKKAARTRARHSGD